MIRATALTGFFRVAHEHGLDPLALLRELGVDPAGLSHPDCRLPISLACQLLDNAAVRGNAPAFGLQMAQLRNKDDIGVLGILLAHQRTLRDALHAIVRYRHLLNDALGIHIDAGGDVVTIREEIICNVPGQTRQAMELAIGIMAKICRGVLGPQWKPRQVVFTHAAPHDRQLHRKFFACPVSFDGDFNGIVCAAADLDAPNPTADPALVQVAETLARPFSSAQPASLTTEVRKAIYLLLPLEQASLAHVARRLNLSARTLQRQLDAEGIDFSAVLGDVRQELALRYLSNARYPIGQVATLLGFSRQSSLTRWVIARFGTSPRTLRQKSAGEPTPAWPANRQ